MINMKATLCYSSILSLISLFATSVFIYLLGIAINQNNCIEYNCEVIQNDIICQISVFNISCRLPLEGCPDNQTICFLRKDDPFGCPLLNCSNNGNIAAFSIFGFVFFVIFLVFGYIFYREIITRHQYMPLDDVKTDSY